MTQSRRQPPTPDAITAALGRRLAELRQAAGIRSQTELGKKMTEQGVPWSRVTVEKLENGRRSAITVQELLALAAVLGIPALALLADPRQPDAVPVEPSKVTDAWTAYYWISGLTHPGLPKGSWSNTSNLLRLGVLHLQICDEIGELPVFRPRQTAADQAALDEQDRARFAALLDVRRDLVRSRAALPPVHFRVAQRAAELNLDLDVPVLDDDGQEP